MKQQNFCYSGYTNKVKKMSKLGEPILQISEKKVTQEWVDEKNNSFS